MDDEDFDYTDYESEGGIADHYMRERDEARNENEWLRSDVARLTDVVNEQIATLRKRLEDPDYGRRDAEIARLRRILDEILNEMPEPAAELWRRKIDG